LALSTELPLFTVLPRAWMGFGKAPWRCMGLAALTLISATGPAVVGQDLRLQPVAWLAQLGDLAVLVSLVLPLLPLLALLKLADRLLPDTEEPRPDQTWRQLLGQTAALLSLELVLLFGGVGMIQSLSWLTGRLSTTLAGLVVIVGGLLLLSWIFSQLLALPLLIHHRCRALQAMDRSRLLVHRNFLKMLALVGLILGMNLLGLIGATLGLLLSMPFSALVLMACCRSQTPRRRDSRRNMLPT